MSGSVVRTVALPLLLIPFVACANASTRPVPANVLAYDGNQVAAFSAVHAGEKASKALIYVNTPAGTVAFDQNGNGPVEQISSGQANLAVDAQGNLYVSSRTTINVYAPGQTKPSRTINLPDSIYTFALDTHGNIWGGIFCANGCQQPELFEFDNQGKLLQALSCFTVELVDIYGLTVDAAGDAFIDGFPTSPPVAVVEFPAGSKTCRVLHTSEQGSGDLQMTEAGNLVVDDQYQNRSLTYAGPKFDKLIATTPYPNVGLGESKLRKGDHQIWVSSPAHKTVSRYPFPAGGTATVTIGPSQLPGYPASIAVAPCAEPNC